MNAVRLIILLVAAVAAIGLAFVVRGAFGDKKASTAVAAPVVTPISKPTAQVLVAKRDLPIGARLTPADVDWQAWPADGLNPAFITDGAPPATPETGAKAAVDKAQKAASTLFGGAAMQQVVGAIVKEPILANEPMTLRKLVRSGEGNYMAVVVQPGMRAMSVSVTVDTGAGGFILPGDRVDVILAIQADGGGHGFVTSTVLKNIRVLAIDQASEPDKEAKTMVGAVATLEIATADTEVLAGAQASAKASGLLVLALRSYADAGAASGRVAQSASPAEDTSTVRVFRNGQSSDVTVTR
jgi:pilus assembly protein CpaB